MKKTPDLIDRHVGNRVRMRRMLMKMSQEKLGEALGLTFQQIQKYEKGLNRIGASRLQQISKTLNVSPSFFFEGAPTIVGAATPADAPAGFEEEAQSQYVVDFMSTAEGVHLNRSFARIKNPKVRRRLVELIAALADAEDGGDETPGPQE
ncbi:helix-turn-helix domain-containing protein [Methylocystis bryophila]|uniref:Transcriptional regulator n=1 Tax=Methylocystis bryophila TaxID=655015 RepID=A0A1W6MS51_9HYPH|nr:helix-turn-helix transcriptional regulator [Methylocystis bryophila]ARN80319.1 transcriptional regulator [Methylocystis bryophila]BDV40297.1 putative HTH-type transcriptional regulator R00410 [Methylocystis bryophila]